MMGRMFRCCEYRERLNSARYKARREPIPAHYITREVSSWS